ncbi:MAG: T9SS type A sorting domain-containing protein [bacterium]|nr:MAG: T9SS type A sorting domain-containing protein [bacterium]
MKRYFFILGISFFIASVAISQEYWYWQNPIPQGNKLNDIWIFDTQLMFAVGDIGTFIKTTDSGKNWEVKHHIGDIASNLYAVFFLTETIGWAGGEEGKILKTTDGGDTWSVQTDLNSSVIKGLFFHDIQNGWAVGNRVHLGDQKGIILKTTDGGANWTMEESTNASHLNAIYFFNENVGWAVGTRYVVEPQTPEDIILRTEDGGITWKSQYSQQTAELYRACFIDSLHGWAVGKGTPAGGKIIYTEDSGISWITQSNPSPTKILWAIAFRDQNLGWAAGEGGTMLKTVDGGDTWDEATSQFSRNLKAIGLTNSQIVMAVGNAGIIIKSDDDGSVWQEMSSAFTRGNYHAVYFTDSDTGWVVGPDKTILKSIDGGKNWTTQGSSGTERLWDVFFVNNRVGWTIGEPVSINEEGIILHTTDGGDEWIEQSSGTNDFLYSCFFINEQVGWICGGPFSSDSSIILYTSDGGNNWTRQTCPANAPLRDIYFIDELNGWAVGDNSNVVHTTDGGLTWSSVSLGNSEDFYSIFFLTPDNGWIGGKSIFQTTDGGSTWDEQLTLSDEDQVHDIYFLDYWIGWAAVLKLGSSGALYKTMDGGLTWDKLDIGTDHGLYDISIINNEYGWVVGTASTILKTDAIVVPVELVSFNADWVDNQVKLAWITATESNNYGFEVQRKFNQEDSWQKIGFVEGHGTTAESNYYSFKDNPQGKGKYSYRLKQIDIDGKFKYSPIRQVTIPGKFALYQNHPNPFNPETTISFELPKSAHVALDIYNMLGQKIVNLIDERRLAGFQKIIWNGRDEAGNVVGSGVYFYHIKTDGFEATKKLVLLR